MPKKKLSNQHANFCRLMVSGSINQTIGYMECYPDSTYNSAMSSACDLLGNPKIKEEIARLKGLAEEGDVMTRKEKREFLAKVKRTPIGQIDENSELAQELTVTDTQHGTRKTIKMMSKKDAVDLDNKMSGDNEPDVVEHNITIKWGDAEK